jgi:hypothetical protein
MSDHPLADFLNKLDNLEVHGLNLGLPSTFVNTDACFEEVKQICNLNLGERNRLRNFIFPTATSQESDEV